MKGMRITGRIVKIAMIASLVMIFLSGLAGAETSRQRVVKEACYALDGGADYSCGDTIKVGNWNYINSDTSAYDTVKGNYNCFSSVWAKSSESCYSSKYTPAITNLPSFYTELDKFGNFDSRGHGGQCKYFANLLVYRAGQFGRPTENSNEDSKKYYFVHYSNMINTPHNTKSIGEVEPGDVIFIEGSKYYTVLSVKAGNSLYGTVTSVEVRDRTGAKTTISNPDLQQYKISKYARGIEFAQPGDVIFDTTNANGADHAAVVVKITGGSSSDGTVSSLDVVDSNWCGDLGKNCEVIKYHPYPTGTHKLEEYYVCTGVNYISEKWSPPNPNLVMYWNPVSNYDLRNGRIYEIRQDPNNLAMRYSHWIIDPKVFNDLGYDWGKLKTDMFSRIWLFLSIPGENIVFKNGVLIKKSDGTIYEMQGGEKHGFTSWQSYLDHGYTASTPTTAVSNEQANAIPTGLVKGYKLVKTSTSPNVYLVQGSEKKLIPNPDVFSFWGFNSADVKTINQVEMDSYSNAGTLYRTKYGTIVGRTSSPGANQFFVSIDSNANLYRRQILNENERSYLGSTKPTYWIGSEIDLMPEGNNYDDPMGLPYPETPEPSQNCNDCHSQPAPTPTPTPTPTPAPNPIVMNWVLSGNNGDSQKYYGIPRNTLNGRKSIVVKYDLNGLCAQGADASALIFDQNGWKYISLSKYGQNCYDGLQTVWIPLSDFTGLNPDANLDINSAVHARFWSSGAFSVDLNSVELRNDLPPTPTPTATPTPIPTPSPTPTPTPTATPFPNPLTLNWHFDASTGGSLENSAALPANILSGKQSVKLTYNLHGNCANPNDASAIAFEQGGQWKYISLSSYGQNCYNGEQSVQIPLSDFTGLDINANVNYLHARFWSSTPYIVDISSIEFRTDLPSSTPAPTPPPADVFQLNWHLVGDNGDAQAYGGVPVNELIGKQSIDVTYDLNGLCALGNDASALIFDQNNEWRYVSLSNYGQNCLDGEQTVTIPLSDFPNLDATTTFSGSVHARFWYSGPFTVDIKTIKFNS